MRGKTKDNRGFSLTELMIVCALIGVLSMIAVPLYMNALHQADEQKAVFNLHAIYQAHKMYYFDPNPNAPVAFDISPGTIDDLSPTYATISQDDGAWTYLLTGSNFGPPPTFTAKAFHKQHAAVLVITETGEVDFETPF